MQESHQQIIDELANIFVSVVGLSEMHKSHKLSYEDMEAVRELVTKKSCIHILDILLQETEEKENMIQEFQKEVQRKGKLAFGEKADIHVDIEFNPTKV